MPFDPCAATHKLEKKKEKKMEESRHWFHDVITGCSVLASFSNLGGDLDSVNIIVFICLMLYMNILRKGNILEGFVNDTTWTRVLY